MGTRCSSSHGHGSTAGTASSMMSAGSTFTLEMLAPSTSVMKSWPLGMSRFSTLVPPTNTLLPTGNCPPVPSVEMLPAEYKSPAISLVPRMTRSPLPAMNEPPTFIVASSPKAPFTPTWPSSRTLAPPYTPSLELNASVDTCEPLPPRSEHAQNANWNVCCATSPRHTFELPAPMFTTVPLPLQNA